MAKIELERAHFVVLRQGNDWLVEHGGEVSSTCSTKEEAKAAANKLARAAQDAGRPCKVTITGEDGYFAIA